MQIWHYIMLFSYDMFFYFIWRRDRAPAKRVSKPHVEMSCPKIGRNIPYRELSWQIWNLQNFCKFYVQDFCKFNLQNLCKYDIISCCSLMTYFLFYLEEGSDSLLSVPVGVIALFWRQPLFQLFSKNIRKVRRFWGSQE